jgi:hypothetical protein
MPTRTTTRIPPRTRPPRRRPPSPLARPSHERVQFSDFSEDKKLFPLVVSRNGDTQILDQKVHTAFLCSDTVQQPFFYDSLFLWLSNFLPLLLFLTAQRAKALSSASSLACYPAACCSCCTLHAVAGVSHALFSSFYPFYSFYSPLQRARFWTVGKEKDRGTGKLEGKKRNFLESRSVSLG